MDLGPKFPSTHCIVGMENPSNRIPTMENLANIIQFGNCTYCNSSIKTYEHVTYNDLYAQDLWDLLPTINKPNATITSIFDTWHYIGLTFGILKRPIMVTLSDGSLKTIFTIEEIKVTLHQVLLVLEFKCNLLSVGKILHTHKNVIAHFTSIS